MVVLGGGADDFDPNAGERTPLATASTPTLDRLAAEGRVGLVRTIPEGLAPGGDVGLVSLMGYDPGAYFTGRGPIEAAGRGVSLGRDEVAFCCHLVTVVDGILVDHTGGAIRTHEAAALLQRVDDVSRDTGIRIHLGHGYQHLAVVRGMDMLDAACTAPQDILGEAAEDYRPRGGGAKRLTDFMRRADAILASHEVNQVRRDLGETPATALWLWGQGVMPILPRFRQQYGLRAAMVCDSDFGVGLAKLLGMTPMPMTVGYDAGTAAYENAAGLAVAAADEHELVVVHFESPCEAGHAGDALAKRTAIERIDVHVVRRLLEHVQGFDQWRLLVAADHAVSTAQKTSSAVSVPFVMAGTGVAAVVGAPGFDESIAAASDLHIERGSELMEYFLRL